MEKIMSIKDFLAIYSFKNIDDLTVLPGEVGSRGKCYIFDYNFLIKKFNKSIPIVSAYGKNLLSMTGVLSDIFVFPSLVLVDNGFIVGILMSRIHSKSLLNHSLYLNTIISKTDDIYEAIDDISDLGIKIYDLFPRNILFSYRESFKIIDTDSYLFSFDSHLYEENIRKYNLCMLNYFGIDDGNNCYNQKLYNFIMNKKNLSEEYKQLIHSFDNCILPDFIDLLKKELGNDLGIKARTRKDLFRL